MPEPTRVLLLRHAETAQPDRFHGAESDVPLGPRGHDQAAAVAQALARLDPAAVYASPMLRARQTAEPIGHECGLPIQIIDSIYERKMGALSGKPIAEGLAEYLAAMDAWKSGDLDAAHEGGESYAQIRHRVVPALTAIAQAHPGQTVVVVAHGVVIRVLLTSLLPELGPADFDRVGIDNAAVNDLRFLAGQWQAVGLNLKLHDLT
jgi:probable phosphoglycerate mutase